MRINLKQTKNERGITLIALIVLIVVIVIISAIVIRGIAGEGILGISETAAEEHNITSYKEQIEQKVRGTVQSYTVQGEEANLIKIAEELNNETLWVKEAIANTNTDLGNEDILITTTDGYIFQIYYNEVYGIVFTEYVGRDNRGEIPTLKARFEKRIAAIMAETKGAVKLELIYRGETTGTPIENPNGEQRIEVHKIGTGWYKLRSTGEMGHLRYAWVRATILSDRLTPPEVTITPVDPTKGNNGMGNDGWYLGPVKVKAETDNEYAKEIRYTIIENGITVKEDQKYESELEVEATGLTRIIMWTVDEEGYTSEEIINDIKIDGEAPKVTYEEKSAKEKVEDWYKEDIEVTIKGEDKGSGIDGYYYKIVGEAVSFSDKKTAGEEGDKIPVTKDGMTEIIVKVIDKAGNESGEERIIIKKDTIAPEFEGNITVNNEKTDGFTINALAKDELSGNPANGGNITYKFYITKDGKEEPLGENNTGIMEVAGLNMDTTYDVRVEAIDLAGNRSEKIGVGTTLANNKPILANVTYKTKTTNSITVGASATDADGDNLTYTIYTSEAENGTYIKSGTATGAAGQEVRLTASELTPYTLYYYYVEVSDGKETVTSGKESQRTYCPGTGLTCNSGYTERCTSGYSDYCSGGSTQNCSGGSSSTCSSGYVESCRGGSSTSCAGVWTSCGNCGGSGTESKTTTTTVSCAMTTTCPTCKRYRK